MSPAALAAVRPTSIIGHEYRVKSGGGAYGEWTWMSGTSATTTGSTVSGLSNNVLYTFQVRVVYWSYSEGARDGLASREVRVTPRFDYSDPGSIPSITGVSLHSTNPSAVNLQLSAAPSGTSYVRVRAHPYSGPTDGAIISEPAFANQVAVTGLSQGEGYTISVRYCTSTHQCGLSSANQEAAPTPHAPTSVTASDRTLSWTSPAGNGSRVWWEAGYSTNVNASQPSDLVEALVENERHDHPDDATTHSVTISGLDSGTAYKLFVRSVVMDSDWFQRVPNAHSAWVSPSGGSVTPTSLVVVGGNGQAQAQWQMPSGGGQAVQGLRASSSASSSATTYEVAWTQAGSDWADGSTQTATDTSATVTGLVNGQSYAFRVRAVQNGDPTGWSQTVHATPATAPAAPSGLSATPGDGALEVAWSAPAETGGADITRYELDAVVKGTAWNEDPLEDDLTESPATVTGLVNGTEYAVRVRAVNSAGEGNWSAVSHATPVASGPSVVLPFPDLFLLNRATAAIDMTEHFSGSSLIYDVMVTTTHKRTGRVKTGPINTVARNKVRGTWSGNVLTLTGGASGDHVLGLAMSATDADGVTAQDDFTLTVGAEAPPEPPTDPVDPATLILAFSDLDLDNGATSSIDMTEHFSGTSLTYEVLVTTTHKRTGKVRTGPINTVARNKVRGAWSDQVLTLTAGPSGHHVLGMKVTATDTAGGEASDDFELEVGSAGGQALATRALHDSLAGQARILLEDASSAVGGRMHFAARATDPLRALADLYGAGSPLPECTLDVSLGTCLDAEAERHDARRAGPSSVLGTAAMSTDEASLVPIDLSELRDRVAQQGLAVSLNNPLPGDPGSAVAPDDALALTFWGQGGPTSGASQTVFWGLDAAMGEDWVTGLAFAETAVQSRHALSGVDVEGSAESSISAFYPYLRSTLGSSTEVWSLMGFGSGTMESLWSGPDPSFASTDLIRLDGEVDFNLGLVGAEHALLEHGGFTLSALGDAGWSRLAVTSGPAQGIDASVSRTRLALQGRYASEDGRWTSALRAGARVDGGDGQTASGLELAGDVQRRWGRWLAGVDGRWYGADTLAAGHGSQGVKATLGFASSSDGTGLSATLSPAWGTQSGLFDRDGLLVSSLDSASDSDALGRIDARASWGMRLPGRSLLGPRLRLSPHVGASFVEGGAQHLRFGVALQGKLDLGLDVERRAAPGVSDAEHGFLVRLNISF